MLIRDDFYLVTCFSLSALYLNADTLSVSAHIYFCRVAKRLAKVSALST